MLLKNGKLVVLVCHSLPLWHSEKNTQESKREAETIFAGSMVQYLVGTKIGAQLGAPIVSAHHKIRYHQIEVFGDGESRIPEFGAGQLSV